jgi:hypothetical protein
VLPDQLAIVARERALRALHGESWLAPLRAILLAGYELRRGLVEHVVAFRADDFTAAAPALYAAAPLVRSLAVPGRFVEEVPTAIADRLEALILLEPCYLDVPQIAAFVASPHLANLRRFAIVNARLTPEGARALLALPAALDHLGLDLNRQFVDYPVEADHVLTTLATARPFAALRSLHLAGIHTADLSPLVALQGLTSLVLRHCRIPARAVLDLATHLPALTSLELDLDLVAELELEALVDLPQLRHLRVRQLRGHLPRTDDGAVAIAASLHTDRHRHLELVANQIERVGARALAKLPGLVRLDLDTIDDDSPRLVQAFQSTYRPPSPAYPAEIAHLLLDSQKLAAIKTYRALTGAAFSEATLAVERMLDDRP